MRKERRTGKLPTLEHLEEALSKAQLQALRKMEGLGWELSFVRRPVFQDSVPVLFHRQSNRLGILEDDGSLNTHPDTGMREINHSVLIACPKCGYMVYGRLWRCPGCGGTGKKFGTEKGS